MPNPSEIAREDEEASNRREDSDSFEGHPGDNDEAFRVPGIFEGTPGTSKTIKMKSVAEGFGEVIDQVRGLLQLEEGASLVTAVRELQADNAALQRLIIKLSIQLGALAQGRYRPEEA